MAAPLLLSDPAPRVSTVDGLSAAIDTVAARAPASHAFLRYQWYAAALAAYGGAARTLLVEDAIALPLVAFGPGPARLAAVPGCYWPFRSFPAVAECGAEAWTALVDALGGQVNALRIGPVCDGDPSATALVAAARARGWAVLDRFVADSFMLDIAVKRTEGPWPRASTLKKNRFHEKHLAGHGALAWEFIDGSDWNDGQFDRMASVEAASWIASRTDGGDAKFTVGGHGLFWREAARDPVLAGMFHAALLSVDGTPAAFSFDIDCGGLKYAIANSYDPRFSKHSPGKLLYYRNLADAAGRGIVTVDWGAGDSGYKSVIGAEKGAAIRDLLLLRPGLPSLLGGALKSLWSRSGN